MSEWFDELGMLGGLECALLEMRSEDPFRTSFVTWRQTVRTDRMGGRAFEKTESGSGGNQSR